MAMLWVWWLFPDRELACPAQDPRFRYVWNPCR